jgi:hypothetical protein
MFTGSGSVFVDRVDRKIRVHAHVNESSTGTGFVHVHVDRGDQPKYIEPVTLLLLYLGYY